MRILLLCLSFLTSCPLANPSHSGLALSTLDPGCLLQVAETATDPIRSEAVFLACKGNRTLVVSPENLYGKVRIQSAEQALEYVRLFTTPRTYRYFDLGGMVEVVEGDPGPQADFNVVGKDIFAAKLVKARAWVTTTWQGQKPEFIVQRTVVFLDQSVCEVTEQVGVDGGYYLANKRVIFSDATKIGIVHLGDL